jgi:hypothetical protein
MNAQTAAITAPSTQDAVQFLGADHRQIEALDLGTKLALRRAKLLGGDEGAD